jgi:hypothetical protein
VERIVLMRAYLILAGALAASSGCIRAGAFACETDTECTRNGEPGTCEANGLCSFGDATCASGRRFGEHAGGYSDRCVDSAGAVVDAGVAIDAAPTDAAIDGDVDAAPPDAATGCPAGYAPLPGVPSHYYKRLGEAGWTNQRSACGSEPANVYLAIPDDEAELLALVALAGERAWVGISDAGSEGDYVTVQGTPATYLPWGPSEPDNNGNQDCVRALATGGAIETATGGMTAVAVCECAP